MADGPHAAQEPRSVPDAATLADVLTRLPTAVVLIDEDGHAVWSNDVVRDLTRRSGDEGPTRLLAAVSEAVKSATPVGETGNALLHARLPTDRGLLERELWTTFAGGSEGRLRIAAFAPDEESALGPASADEHTHRLEAMLAHTEDLITLLGADGTIRASNAAAGRLTGFSGGGVNGRNALDFVHPDDVAVATGTLNDVLDRPGGTVRASLRVRFADDTWHDVEASVTNLLDDRSVASLVISMHDVTDRVLADQRVVKSEAQMRSLVENLTDVIVVLDNRFEIVYATPGIEQIIDAPAATNVGMSAFNDVHPDDLDDVVTKIGALASAPLGEAARVELRLEERPRSGRWRWIEATAVNRLQDPNVQGMVCTLRDVTEAKAAAEELRRAFDQLSELDALKDQFLASVSHEMRTPLAIIIGFADLLGRGDELDASVRAEAIDRVRSSAAEMRTMVDNLLDFSALEAGRLSVVLKSVRVAHTVAFVLNTIRAVLSEHAVEVDVPEDLQCQADHDALDRILRNLLTNAARYSQPGSAIRVVAESERDGGVRIDVTDEGVGIPEDQLGHVFERLHRGPDASFVSRGAGVGLNMVKRYAELMGGSVSVRSTAGAGSTFSVRLGAVQ
ncbi:MAG TPA: PAS domain-containing sensor histidine kinase [Acidimicrobiales bacterium]|nr:PAS domain-containing sensor histidine kinase [Acidimicrobiales bacterium]